LQNPYIYVQSNLVGFCNLLECCRRYEVEHLVYASSSSVYGANTQLPFSVHDGANHPVSLYAATKKANELLAHTYSHLYELPTTGLRYFTAYGPWGRPDMSPWLFTGAILEGKTINIHNHGEMHRDFTYIDDIAEGTVRSVDRIPKGSLNFSTNNPDPATSYAPYKVYNIGNQDPIELMTFVNMIEKSLGLKANKIFLPMQFGDIKSTYANIQSFKSDIGFEPKTSLEEGVEKWVNWYRDHHKNY
jgi:UDP-glucuronate 4-epimerase